MSGASAYASDASAWLGQCQYYQARSSELNCAPEGYLLAFGERYCQVFVDHVQAFSPAAQTTLAHLRLCLQEKLEERNDLTCGNVKSIAAHSHIECYVQNHFCEMKLRDKLTLARLIAPALLDEELRQAVTSIETECVREHLGGRPPSEQP